MFRHFPDLSILQNYHRLGKLRPQPAPRSEDPAEDFPWNPMDIPSSCWDRYSQVQKLWWFFLPWNHGAKKCKKKSPSSSQDSRGIHHETQSHRNPRVLCTWSAAPPPPHGRCPRRPKGRTPPAKSLRWWRQVVKMPLSVGGKWCFEEGTTRVI